MDSIEIKLVSLNAAIVEAEKNIVYYLEDEPNKTQRAYWRGVAETLQEIHDNYADFNKRT